VSLYTSCRDRRANSITAMEDASTDVTSIRDRQLIALSKASSVAAQSFVVSAARIVTSLGTGGKWELSESDLKCCARSPNSHRAVRKEGLL